MENSGRERTLPHDGRASMDIQKIKVFLIDVDPRSAISGSLRETFASEVRASVLLRETAVGADRAVPSYGELISTILDFKPNIIFLNLSMDRLEGIGKFIQSVSKEPVDIPVIIITQDCGPEEMIALLELGVVDLQAHQRHLRAARALFQQGLAADEAAFVPAHVRPLSRAVPAGL